MSVYLYIDLYRFIKKIFFNFLKLYFSQISCIFANIPNNAKEFNYQFMIMIILYMYGMWVHMRAQDHKLYTL